LCSFFKECPHPDDKQRKELSRELGLEPLQVKFWFQNKRTQMKVQKTSENTVISILFICPIVPWEMKEPRR
jgi:homeobox-leucine zipper protein